MDIVGSVEQVLGKKLAGETQPMILRRNVFPDKTTEDGFAGELRDLRAAYTHNRGFTRRKEWRHHASLPPAVYTELAQKYGVQELGKMIAEEHPLIQQWLVVRNRPVKPRTTRPIVMTEEQARASGPIHLPRPDRRLPVGHPDGQGAQDEA